MGILAVLQWVGVLQQVVSKGTKAWVDVKTALANNGIEADTSALENVIADAARRKAIAQAEIDGN